MGSVEQDKTWFCKQMFVPSKSIKLSTSPKGETRLNRRNEMKKAI